MLAALGDQYHAVVAPGQRALLDHVAQPLRHVVGQQVLHLDLLGDQRRVGLQRAVQRPATRRAQMSAEGLDGRVEAELHLDVLV